MTVHEEKIAYMAMPPKYRKHGDWPTQREMQDDLEAYAKMQAEAIPF